MTVLFFGNDFRATNHSNGSIERQPQGTIRGHFHVCERRCHLDCEGMTFGHLDKGFSQVFACQGRYTLEDMKSSSDGGGLASYKSRWSRNLQNSSKNGCFCASSKTCVALHIFGRRLMAVAIQSLRILGHFTCFSEFSQLCGHWCNPGAVETVEHTNWLLCQCCRQREHCPATRFHLELPFDSRWRQVLQNCFCSRILNTGPPFSWHCAYTIKNEQIPWKAVVWRLVSFWEDNFPEASVFRYCPLAHFPDESVSIRGLHWPMEGRQEAGKGHLHVRKLSRLDMRSMRFQSTKPSRNTFPNWFVMRSKVCWVIFKYLQISSNFF